MKNNMTTLNRVMGKLSKLNKNELKAQKIELGLIDQLKSISKNVDQIVSSANARAQKAESMYQSTNAENAKAKSQVEGLVSQGFDIYRNARASFKELGVTMPKEYNDIGDQLSSSVGRIPVSNLANIYS